MAALSLFFSLLAMPTLARLPSAPHVTLPLNLIVAYADWGECDDKMVSAAVNGVNVLIWFAVNVVAHPNTSNPIFVGGPDQRCVANISRVHHFLKRTPSLNQIIWFPQLRLLTPL